MKYNIALCDDDLSQLKVLKAFIEKVNNINNAEIFITEALNSEELFHKIKDKHLDVFFLDIEMDGMNGLEIGRKVRELYPKAIIIFITGFKDYALNAFEIKAFDYIIKPISFDKFENSFKEICERLEEIRAITTKEKVFSISTKEQSIKVNYSNIYYFEKHLRKIKIVCSKETLEFYGSFKKLLNDLDMNYFTQCHQSFIVNNEFIYSYKNQNIFIGPLDESIPVSKSYVKSVKESLSKNLFK